MATKKTTTKKAAKPAAAKAKAKKAKPAGDKKLSQIDAAIRVLADAERTDELHGDGRGHAGQGLLDEPGRQDAVADVVLVDPAGDRHQGRRARFRKADRGKFAHGLSPTGHHRTPLRRPDPGRFLLPVRPSGRSAPRPPGATSTSSHPSTAPAPTSPPTG